MRILEFRVPKEYNGVKLKGFLRGYCDISARLLIQLKMQENGIQVNGLQQTVRFILNAGDIIKLSIPEKTRLPQPVELPFQVCFEDEDLIIVDKPCGMPMYPTNGHDCDSLSNAAASYFTKNSMTGSFRPVYRLDKDTSGLIVLAKNTYAAYKLAAQIDKEYYAVCEGILTGSGTIDLPIGILPGHWVQRGIMEDGEKAVTHWNVIGNGEGHSLLKFKLETGRTHQIRVHMSSMGYPLAGDDMYGGGLTYISRQALHCGRIILAHPVTCEKCCFYSPFPEDIKTLCQKFDLTDFIPNM